MNAARRAWPGSPAAAAAKAAATAHDRRITDHRRLRLSRPAGAMPPGTAGEVSRRVDRGGHRVPRVIHSDRVAGPAEHGPAKVTTGQPRRPGHGSQRQPGPRLAGTAAADPRRAMPSMSMSPTPLSLNRTPHAGHTPPRPLWISGGKHAHRVPHVMRSGRSRRAKHNRTRVGSQGTLPAIGVQSHATGAVAAPRPQDPSTARGLHRRARSRGPAGCAGRVRPPTGSGAVSRVSSGPTQRSRQP